MGETDAGILYGLPAVEEYGISLHTLDDWRLAWEQEDPWAMEGSWGTLAQTHEACLTHNKVLYQDDYHRTAGKAPCPDPFHEGHQPHAIYHLRASADRDLGYPGLPNRLAIYRISKSLTLEEAGQDYRPRYQELIQEAGRTTGRMRNRNLLKAQALKETPLAKTLDSSLPNAVTRFARRAREQGKDVYIYRKYVEFRGDHVAAEEFLLADAGIDWGRMKGVELLAESDKQAVISEFTSAGDATGQGGLGQGGWSRSEWPEDLARAAVTVLESNDGRKGRTRAGWFPGAKELVAEPQRSPCPECGGDKTLVGPLRFYHRLVGPIISDVTGQPFYQVVDTRKAPPWETALVDAAD